MRKTRMFLITKAEDVAPVNELFAELERKDEDYDYDYDEYAGIGILLTVDWGED